MRKNNALIWKNLSAQCPFPSLRRVPGKQLTHLNKLSTREHFAAQCAISLWTTRTFFDLLLSKNMLLFAYFLPKQHKNKPTKNSYHKWRRLLLISTCLINITPENIYKNTSLLKSEELLPALPHLYIIFAEPKFPSFYQRRRASNSYSVNHHSSQMTQRAR